MQYYGRENVSVDIKKKKMDKVIQKKNNYVIQNFEYTLFYYIYNIFSVCDKLNSNKSFYYHWWSVVNVDVYGSLSFNVPLFLTCFETFCGGNVMNVYGASKFIVKGIQ